MTLAQSQSYSPGEIIDRSRTRTRSRCYDAPLKRYTVTIGGTATTGVYSFDVDGTTVSYTASVGADTNTVIATELYEAAIDNDIDVIDVCAVSRDALVITLTGRETGDSFTVDNAVVTGPGTLTIANPEDGVEGDLELGIGVCLVASDSNSIRRPTTGDTKIFGIVCEGGNIKKSTGVADDVDCYEPGSPVEIGRMGPIPLVVEEAVSAGDPIYCRVESDTGKTEGEFRNDAGAVSQVTQGDVETNYVAAVSQVTNGTVAYNATDDVGVIVDGLAAVFVASNTSNDQTAADLVVEWNGNPAYAAIATASSVTATFTLTFLDDQVHTVTSYSPATADITGITNATAAVAAVADAVGLTVDSLTDLYVTSLSTDDATATALVAAWNASAIHHAAATATVDLAGATSLIVLTFNDYEAHTVTAYSPATANVSSITNSTTAVSARAVLVPGEFLSDSYTDTATGKTVAIAEVHLPA